MYANKSVGLGIIQYKKALKTLILRAILTLIDFWEIRQNIQYSTDIFLNSSELYLFQRIFLDFM